MDSNTLNAPAQTGLAKSDEVLLCLRCSYDLSGISDGKCPECGDAFTRRMLVEETKWRAVNAAEASVRRWRSAWDLLFAGLFFYWYVGFIFGTPSTRSAAAPIVFLAWWAGLVAIWMFRARPEWEMEAPRILYFLIPLEIFLAILFYSPHRVWAVPMFVIAGAALSLASLRFAPWASCRWIAVLVLPFFLGGLGIYRHALARGDGWSEFDRWTGETWKAMRGVEAKHLGLAMAGVAAGFMIAAAAGAWWLAQPVGRSERCGGGMPGVPRSSAPDGESTVPTD